MEPKLRSLRNILSNRKYKSGTEWCLWRWTDVDSEYITRLHLIQAPLGAICLHWINKPDVEPFLHDHPVTFLSLILRGGYWENRNGTPKRRRFFNFVRASKNDRHKITVVEPGTLTLCFMGPKTREWGFQVPGRGWVMWKDYYKELRSKNG